MVPPIGVRSAYRRLLRWHATWVMVSSQGKIAILATREVGLLAEKEELLWLPLALTTPPNGLFGIQPGRREAYFEGERRFHGRPNHGGEALTAHPNPSRKEV